MYINRASTEPQALRNQVDKSFINIIFVLIKEKP
jgi:hypothetical protein